MRRVPRAGLGLPMKRLPDGRLVIDMPGVNSEHVKVQSDYGCDPKTRKPYKEAPKGWLSTREVRELLGLESRATRALLCRHKVKRRMVEQEKRCACLYWDGKKVKQLAELRGELLSGVPAGWMTARDAVGVLGVGRSTLSRYEQKGLLVGLRARVKSPTGLRVETVYERKAVRGLAKIRAASLRTRLLMIGAKV